MKTTSSYTLLSIAPHSHSWNDDKIQDDIMLHAVKKRAIETNETSRDIATREVEKKTTQSGSKS